VNLANQDNKSKLIVFTDLDGTLLDHDSYQFDEAKPALNRLKALSVPVIPTTSKTFAEAEVLLKELDLMSPVIVENGGIIAIPPGFKISESEKFFQVGDFKLLLMSVDYASIISVLDNLRTQYKFQFRGFNDMGVEELAHATSLPAQKAANAQKRLCSEPLIWLDSKQRLAEFEQLIHQHHLSMTQGGRFWHVMGEVDKSIAMKKVIQLCLGEQAKLATVIALGDNPNDVTMLKSADIGVVIRRKDSSCLSFESENKIYTSDLPGPAGWNAFFMWYLDEYLKDTNNECLRK